MHLNSRPACGRTIAARGDTCIYVRFLFARFLTSYVIQDLEALPDSLLHVLPEGANGQLPNLDLLNTLVLGLEHESLRATVYTHPAVDGLQLPHPLGGLLSFVASLASGMSCSFACLLVSMYLV